MGDLTEVPPPSGEPATEPLNRERAVAIFDRLVEAGVGAMLQFEPPAARADGEPMWRVSVRGADQPRDALADLLELSTRFNANLELSKYGGGVVFK